MKVKICQNKNTKAATLFLLIHFAKCFGLSTPSWFIKRPILRSLFVSGGGVECCFLFLACLSISVIFLNFLDMSTRTRKNMTPWHPLAWHCPAVFSILGGDKLATLHTLSLRENACQVHSQGGRSLKSSVANRIELLNCLCSLLVNLVVSHCNRITGKVTSHTTSHFLHAIYPHHRIQSEHVCIFPC